MSEENEKRLKEYQKNIVRLKIVFHKCKCVKKMCYKDICDRSFINF